MGHPPPLWDLLVPVGTTFLDANCPTYRAPTQFPASCRPSLEVTAVAPGALTGATAQAVEAEGLT